MYKEGEAIDIIYQAPNKETGLSGVVAEIILPDGSQDSGFPDVVLTEILSKGVYKGQFTPDQEGDWEAICHKSDGDGQVVKRYSVGAHNVHSVGEGVSGITTAVAALPDAAGVNAEVDSALAEYGVSKKADEDAAHVVTDGKIDALDIKVSSLDTPPMVS